MTKEKYPKQELIRVVKTKEGNIIVDETGKVNGHGAYLKKDVDVVEIEDSIYEEIINKIN